MKVLYERNSFFTNPHEDICGLFTKCELKEIGCSALFTSDKLTIVPTTGKIEAM